MSIDPLVGTVEATREKLGGLDEDGDVVGNRDYRVPQVQTTAIDRDRQVEGDDPTGMRRRGMMTCSGPR
jgi:hypothetical protein